jgi:hypothetical protein
MKLSKKSEGNFAPHDEGNFVGVLVDITPLVKRETQFGTKEEFRLVFETNAPAREDGSAQLIWSRGFTPSLNEKAAFRKFLRQWFGRDLTVEEESDLDTELLLGKCGNLVIVHEVNGDKTYANIAACTPHRGDTLSPTGKFVRKKDKEPYDANKGSEAAYRGAAKPSEAPAAKASVDNTEAGSDWSTVKVCVGANAGVELRDLDAEAIGKLVDRWLPTHKANKKPTADEKRLAAALVLAQEAIASASTPAEY